MAENGLFSRISFADKKKSKQRMAYFSSRNEEERLKERLKFSKLIVTGEAL